MTAPFVGLPTESQGCAYSPSLEISACGAPPTVHILSEAPGWGPVALESCTAHAPVARAAGAVMGEHTWGVGCPETCWLDTSDAGEDSGGAR